jgi:hypothetical protein
LGRIGAAALSRAPWFERWATPRSFDLLAWVALTPKERDALEAETATTARTFLQGGAGLLAAAPSKEVATAILEGCETMLRDNIDQIDRTPSPAQIAEFRDTLRQRFHTSFHASVRFLSVAVIDDRCSLRGNSRLLRMSCAQG